jgi:hypothetical protein
MSTVASLVVAWEESSEVASPPAYPPSLLATEPSF